MKRTIEFKGKKNIPIQTTGEEKTHYTVALTVSLTGEKLPCFLIWPGKGAHKGDGLPDNVYCGFREKAWMDHVLMKQWITDILKKRERRIAPGKKGLLILDNFSAHVSTEVKKRLKNAISKSCTCLQIALPNYNR
jgi:hypothetical protein